MIQLTRSLCRQLRVIVKKALGRVKPDLQVTAGPEGLKIQAKGHQHAVEYHDPQPHEPAELTVPLALLEDVQGTKDEPVRLYCPKKKVLAATWEDHGVERTMQYTQPKADSTQFPDQPPAFSDNPPTLLRALHNASQCVDPSSSRYALGCIQLRGAFGQLAATDGRQLFLQSGYNFGFQEEVLFLSTDVFGCSEMPQDQVVQVGKTATHLVVRVGPWSCYSALGDGRFPHVSDIIPSLLSAKTTLELHPADAQFYAENIKRLPGTTDNQAVTFDCNGRIAVRAKTDDTQPTEIILTNSTKTGEDVTICLSRRNLASVAAMGFDQIYLYGKENAVLARDDHRSYLFMPLHNQSAIQPSDDCLKIPSPFSSRSSCSYPRPYTPTVPMNNQSPVPATMPAQTTTPSQQVPQPVRRRRQTSKTGGSVLEQATAVREQLRNSLSGVKDLIRALKTERRSQKSLKLALDSLKQLQKVA